MRPLATLLNLQEMQWMRPVHYLHAVPELPWDRQYQEMPDEVHVEAWAQCPRTRRSTGGLVLWGKHLLDSYCQQQHTISLSSAEVKLHEIVNGTARGLFIRNVLRAKELRATVRVGADSSAAAGITQVLGAGRVRHLVVKGLWIQEEIRSHGLRILRVKSVDNRADLLMMFLGPEGHHKLIKLLPLSVTGTRRGLANAVALGVVCALLPFRSSAGNQLEKVEKTEEMSAAGWLARG